ncbi:MAG: heavy metal translocating P-type ATPase [Succinivibrio sp.]|nr:heavy metal translocating P-type ATPase [Succinivibrio sp.]
MEKRVYKVRGMSCAACALKVEQAVKRLQGVSEVNVMLLQNRMSLRCEEQELPEGLIEDAVHRAGYEASLASDGTSFSTDKHTSLAELKRLYACIVLTVLLMLLSMGPHLGLIILSDPHLNGAAQLMLTLSVMLLQRHYFSDALRALVHGGFNMNTLIALGSLVSFSYSALQLLLNPVHPELYFEGAACILTFVSIGKFIEGRSKLKTTDALSALYDLAPKFVRVEREGLEVMVPAAEVKAGEVVLLKAGDQVGIDGVVLSGSGHLDESALTGESVPVKKQAGESVLSSTVVLNGSLKVRADKVGADTTLSKIIELVNETASHKAPVQRLADRVAGIFVPLVLLISLGVFLSWYFLLNAELGQALSFATSVLVVSCPCALGLATPVAIMAGTGRAAQAGILFKTPEALEMLQSARLFAFDKTGTLTYGNLKIHKILSKEPGLDDINAIFAASLEQYSSHPLARAFLKRAEGSRLFTLTDYKELEGQGITARFGTVQYALGNQKIAGTVHCSLSSEDLQTVKTYEQLGYTTLGLYQDSELKCLFVVGDELKLGAKFLISTLKEQGRHTLMLTGDNERVAQALSAELGLDDYRAELLPQEKSGLISRVQEQGHRVVMVGDGVNDSVSLSCADVGIGMAGASDLALSSCDIVLLRENLYDVYNALKISQQTLLNIKENLFWAFIYNIIFIPMAAGVLYEPYGLKLTPMYAALLMSLSSVCVVLNALRLSRIKLVQIKDSQSEGISMQKKIAIEGMHCEHCVAAVSKYLSALPGVSEVKVSLDENCATLKVPEVISDEMLSTAVENAGFKVTGISAC